MGGIEDLGDNGLGLGNEPSEIIGEQNVVESVDDSGDMEDIMFIDDIAEDNETLTSETNDMSIDNKANPGSRYSAHTKSAANILDKIDTLKMTYQKQGEYINNVVSATTDVVGVYVQLINDMFNKYKQEKSMRINLEEDMNIIEKDMTGLVNEVEDAAGKMKDLSERTVESFKTEKERVLKEYSIK